MHHHERRLPQAVLATDGSYGADDLDLSLSLHTGGSRVPEMKRKLEQDGDDDHQVGGDEEVEGSPGTKLSLSLFSPSLNTRSEGE